MGLAWLQRSGHTPIALVGGGTGMVGDPSGKSDERPMLGLDQIDRNVEGIARQLARVLAFEGSNAARMRNNADWLRGIRLMDFLRDTGKHFTLGYMLQKESVRSRLERGHLVHRVQLHADPGLRLLAPPPDRALRAPDGRERPVGQHHGRHRADRPARRQAGRTGWSFRCSPASSGSKFGKSEGGQHLARPGADEPVPLLPVLGEHRGRGRGALPQAVHLSAARADRGGHGGAWARSPDGARRSASWPARSR